MSQDFTTRLQLQLREAALRDERRSPLRRRLAGLRLGMPGPAAATAVALAAALVVAVVVAGGLRWGGGDERVSHPKVVADFPLADNVGFLSSGFGAVWAADAKNLDLLRVDPRTHAITARIHTGGDTNAFGGDPIVNTGAGAVWAIARAPSSDGGHRVLRIDPETNRVTARVTLPARQAPLVFNIQVVDGRPWVLTNAGAIELDPATARPRSFVAVDQPAGEPGPIWSIIAGKELWVLTRSSTVDRYDISSGRRVASDPVPVTGAEGVVPTQEGPLYGLRNGVLALVDESGKEVWRRQVGTTSNPPFVQGGTVWVHASDMEGGRDRLVELDLASGKPRSSTGLPEFGIMGFTVVGDDLWLSASNGHVMIVRPG
jgi:outer membrane protein assembly factor BamB